MIIYNADDRENIAIELDSSDKWWLKKVLEKENIDIDKLDDNELIDINFFEEDGVFYPYSLFDESKIDLIEVCGVETIKDILNSKSRVRNRFYYEFRESV